MQELGRGATRQQDARLFKIEEDFWADQSSEESSCSEQALESLFDFSAVRGDWAHLPASLQVVVGLDAAQAEAQRSQGQTHASSIMKSEVT